MVSGEVGQVRRSSRVTSLGVVLCMVLAALFYGCNHDPDPGHLPGDGDVKAASAALGAPGTTCVTIREGVFGTSEDTFLSGDYPTWAPGASTSLWTGESSGGAANRVLLQFGLSALPAGAVVTSGKVALYVSWNESNTNVSIHQVLVPWSEDTVTLASFGSSSSWAPDAAGSFLAGGVGTKTVDITALVAGWVSGATPNHGILLQEPGPASHVFRSKEVTNAVYRPALDVCYTLDPCAGVVCTALDQCHGVGTCDAATGQCSNPTVVDGTACNDGSACTQSDACQAGTCTGVSSVTCTASDACHMAGTCDAATGQCSNPAAVDGTACDDGNGCTQSDVCQAGTCAGANPVACVASDACHTAGTCDPATGQCSNPAATNGTACDDGNGCTQSDVCQAGTCTGANPVACAALDACHTAGTCEPATGQCTNPTATDGTACDDGSACTQSDACQAGTCTGANPVACAALDACHTAGACNPATGQCTNPTAANGTACDDGDACTQSDACQAGTCTGANPVACAASDACHAPGTCDPANGQCSNPIAANGTACDDGNGCTQSDACQDGTCTAVPVVCAAVDACHLAGTCDSATGQCTNPVGADGGACTDGNPGTEFDTCQAGTCVGANSVVITIQSPADGTVANTSTIVVTGTLSEVATVKIGAVDATVNGLSFSATVQLHEGSNIIAVQALGATGNPGAASAVVLHDETPPHLTITAPASNAVVAGNTITVTGTVNDMLIGTVNPGDCAVTVNGVAATVENRGFRAVNVPVAEGAGTITAIATDVAGNTASAVIPITGDMTSNAMIFAAGGDAQAAVVGSTLPQPFTAFVANNTGVGVPAIPVTFKVTRSNGVLANGARSETVLSDAQGFASTTLTLGSGTGAASDQVVATAAAFLGAATFAADGVVDPAGERVLAVASGGNQLGAVDTLAAVPLGVFLADEQGNPIVGQSVTFTVKQGGGRVDGASAVTYATDTDGRTYALLTYGSTPGQGTQLVEATATGANAVQFIGSTVVAGLPADTDLSGVVLTNENDPIVNVNMVVKGTAISVLTDVEGHFTLPGVPVGPIHLEINGGTAGPYPTLTFDLEMISGIENVMDRPIYLPTVDSDGMGTANPTTDIVLRRDDTPGLVMTVLAGSATFATANGPQDTGTVQVIRVNNDKIPMLPSAGAIPTLAFAIMPHGATFDPPAQIEFPNVDGRAPGEVVQIYSYDHDLSTFVVVGTAQVSEDGQMIKSEAGQGIRKGGWHYTPPRSPRPGTVCANGNNCLRIVKCTYGSCLYANPTSDQCTAPANPTSQDIVCARGKLDSGANSGQLRATSPPSEVCKKPGETCSTALNDTCCENGGCVGGVCNAGDLPYNPDADCFESGTDPETCAFSGQCNPLRRSSGSACIRGYHPGYPIGLTGQPGTCVGTVLNGPRTCCPNTNYYVCDQTNIVCANGIIDQVCCSTPCVNGCCN